jgi:hypothetical protein
MILVDNASTPNLIQIGSGIQKAHRQLCDVMSLLFFNFRGEILNLLNPSGRTRPWGLLSL